MKDFSCNNQIIEDLQWRYATKRFDSSKQISRENLNTLIEVVRLAPSSYGMQPIKLFVIENKDLREKLRAESYDQSQITDASHLFILCSNLEVGSTQIEEHIAITSEIRGGDPEKLVKYGEFMKKTFSKLTTDEHLIWSSKQAYIALGHLLHACAQLRIDATPMEGFKPEGYDQILGLSQNNWKAILAIPVGYRTEDDHHQFTAKVRKTVDNFVEFID